MTEEQLVKACLKNNRKAQELLYERYHALCYGICLRYARNESDADDIFQESLIKVFKSLRQLKEPKALYSWIKKTIIRTALNFYQILPHTNVPMSDEVTFDIEGDSSNTLLSKMVVDELVDLINKMPDGYRQVFNMYVIDGYKHREIAEILDISESTSKSQLRDAKQYLKKMLTQVGVTKINAYA